MLYFLKKSGKIAAALGDPPPNPHWPPAAEDFAPDPQVVALTELTCHFYALMLRFLAIIKITTYYVILDQRLVGHLAKLASSLSPWLKPLVTSLLLTMCIIYLSA